MSAILAYYKWSVFLKGGGKYSPNEKIITPNLQFKMEKLAFLMLQNEGYMYMLSKL